MSVLDEVEKLKQQAARLDTMPQDTTHQTALMEQPATEKPTEKPILPVEQKGDMVTETVKKAMMAKAQEEAGQDMRGLVRDMTYVKGASDLQDDESFRQTYQEELGQQLVEDLKAEGKRRAIIEASKKQQAINMRNAAFYEGCMPIFQLLGIESAYGLVPMVITVVLLMVPFLAISLVRFIINSVNSIFTAIAGFRKPAYWICSIVVIAVITVIVAILGMWVIDTVFGTSILKATREALQ